MPEQPDVPPDISATGRLQGSLGVVAIVFMVVAAASPLTVVGAVAPIGILIGNGIGFPSLFGISAVILVLFAVGLVAMTRHVPQPGGFFTYVSHGLGPAAGLAAAWLAMLAYTAVQVSVHSYLGYILSTTLKSLTGLELPWWLFSLAVVAIVGFLGYRHIDLSSKVLGLMLVLEVAIVLVLAVAVVATGGADGLNVEPFEPANILSGAPGIGLVFAIASFTGFEATVIFRDEARRPNRTIPRATYAAVIGIGVFYTLGSWAIVMAWGTGNVVAKAAEDPGTMIIATMYRYLGVVGKVGVNVLLITAMFACVLSFHNVLARYQLSMARGGTLPRRLSVVHPLHRSPHVSSLAQTTTAATFIILFAVLRLDPVHQVFAPLGGVTTLAIVMLMALTSVAVLAYFAKTRADRRVWNTVMAPILGLVGLLGSAALIIAYFPLLVGDVDAHDHQVIGGTTVFLLSLVVVFPVFGLLQTRVLAAKRPEAYRTLIERVGAQ